MFILSRIIGYARVSTEEQNLDLQKIAIEKYAKSLQMEVVLYVEKISSRKVERIELNNAIKAAAKGDIFVVYKLDRLARSTKELYQITDNLSKKEISFVSIYDHFDTTTATGKAMFAVFAEFERDIIQQRTQAGLEAARKRGKVGGRPSIDIATKRRIKKLFDNGESASDLAKEYGVGRSTVYKILKDTIV